MADKKITQFDTFEGTADSGVFFVVASGDSNNPLSKNYRFPFDTLSADVASATSPWKSTPTSLYTLTGLVGLGTPSPAYQLDVAGTISGYSGKFKEGIFSEGLTISGQPVATGAGGKWEEVSPGSIQYEGAVFTEDVFDCANLYLQNQDGAAGAALRSSGHSFMLENVAVGHNNPSARLHVTGGKILAPSGDFTESLTVSGVSVATGAGGKWSDGASAGDIYYDGGKVGVGMDPAYQLSVKGGVGDGIVVHNSLGALRSALYLDVGDNAVFNLKNNVLVDGVHLSASGTSNFQGPLTISGNPVSTGAGGGAGKWIDDPAYALGITYEDGPVAISGDLRVSGSGYFASDTIFVGDQSIKASADYLIISGSGVKVGDPGSEATLLSTEKMGLGTSADLSEEPEDIQFKLLTDENRFVVGTTGQPGGDLSGWYRFNDYTVKGATDIGAHIMNPVDTRVYNQGTTFLVLGEDSDGAPIGYISNGSGALSANSQIAIGISPKLDNTESPRDLEFTDTDGEVYSIINGDSDSLAANGLPVSQGLQAPSMGGVAATLLIDGGYF